MSGDEARKTNGDHQSSQPEELRLHPGDNKDFSSEATKWQVQMNRYLYVTDWKACFHCLMLSDDLLSPILAQCLHSVSSRSICEMTELIDLNFFTIKKNLQRKYFPYLLRFLWKGDMNHGSSLLCVCARAYMSTFTDTKKNVLRKLWIQKTMIWVRIVI